MMKKLQIPNIDVEIDMSNVTGVHLDFSGGPDSALLGYILAKYKNEIDTDLQLLFANYQAKDIHAHLTPKCQKIVDWISESNGNVDIKFEPLVMDRSSLSDPEDLELVDAFEDEVIDRYALDIRSGGVYNYRAIATNMHMPEDLMETLYSGRWQSGYRPNRVYGKTRLVKNETKIKPFVNNLKDDLRLIADTLGITDQLLDLTNSCNKHQSHPDISYHCGECYNCIERHWAYGRY